MEQNKISKLLSNLTVSNFVSRKWIEVNDLTGLQYPVNKNIRFKTPMLRSDLCDYSDAYIVLKREITIKNTDHVNIKNKKVTFKNNILFKSRISRINNTVVDNAEDLKIVMPIHNLLEYSSNYSDTTGRLRFS